MTIDFTIMLPPEVLSRIAKSASTDTDRHRLLHVNRRMFKVTVPHRYKSIHIDSYFTLNRAAPMFTTGNTNRLALYQAAPIHVVVGHRLGTPAWDFVRTFTVLNALTAIRTLEISHLPNFPYNSLAQWISGIDTLKSLDIRAAAICAYMPRYHTPVMPLSFPSLTRLHLVNFRWTTIEGVLDQSTSSVTLLSALNERRSALSSLRSFSADVRSWIAMGKGRRCDRLSFPSHVTELEIIAGPEGNMEDLRDEAWARNLFRALRDCRENLESLRVELPYGTHTMLDAPIAMSRLSVVVGPEGIFRNLALQRPVVVLWMTSCNFDSDVEPDGWETILPALREPSSLRMLRVGSWDTQILNMATTLSRFPNLEELWLTTRTQLSKAELIQLGNAFVQCPNLWSVSILGPSGVLQPYSAAVDIATAWHATAQHIGSVRLSASEKWHLQYDWDEQIYVWVAKSKPYHRGFKQTNLPGRLTPANLVVPPYDPTMDGVVEYPASDTEYESASEAEESEPDSE